MNGINPLGVPKGVSTSPTTNRKSSKKANISSSSTKDEFVPSKGASKDVGIKGIKYWMDASKVKNNSAIISKNKPVPVSTKRFVGWKVKLMGEGKTNSYIRIPLKDKDNFLVIPAGNVKEGLMGLPVVVDPQKGIVAFADVNPLDADLGKSYFDKKMSGESPNVPFVTDLEGLKYVQSEDRENLIFYGVGDGNKIIEYGKDLKKKAEFTLPPKEGYGEIYSLLPAKDGYYAFVRSKKLSSDEGHLIFIDSKTHDVKWDIDIGSSFIRGGLQRDNNGNIYLLSGFKEEENFGIKVFSPDGKLLHHVKPKDGIFVFKVFPDGTIFMRADKYPYKSGFYKISQKMTKKGKVSTLKPIWEREMELERLSITSDGKYLYGVDPKSGFYRSYNFVKLDAKDGSVIWNKEAFGAGAIIDYKEVGDDVYLLTSTEKKDATVIISLDAKTGKEKWTEKLPVTVNEYNTDLKDAITPDGKFIFGTVGGDLYFIHPKKAPQEEKEIGKSIDHQFESVNQYVKVSKESKTQKPQKEIKMGNGFVSIGNITLKRKDK